ncbi:CaiB/BaiF CoA transferase family protein [Nakamurella leprariae]|uniref:CoA transferase n=1 Tax=Nakamurella leprariae TaxID=2803911 RepID=A0A939BZD7_9ACTN|nr:CoA transferase [Nakamurella leprariae]MBM9467591.1 CoA transferase [Nakamurella leprariae]
MTVTQPGRTPGSAAAERRPLRLDDEGVPGVSRSATPGALEGVRVLDLSKFWAGPALTEVLGNMGAEVIKVEAVQSPDPWRAGGARSGPTSLGDAPPAELSAIFNAVNRNKLGITLDLSREEGRDLFRRLVPQVDVVVENYTPRVMAKFGFQWPALRELNPELVYISLPGFGSTGPWKDHVGYAWPTEETSGFPHLTGYEGGRPMLWGSAAADAIAGVTGAVGVLAALLHRRRTGVGQWIDLSQVEALTSFLGGSVVDAALNGTERPRRGNTDLRFEPQGVHPAAGDDRWVVVAVQDDTQWAALCGVIGRADLAERTDLADRAGRAAAREEIATAISDWTRDRPGREAATRLQEAGVAAAPVTPGHELIEDPQLQARDFFEFVDRRWIGPQPHHGMWAKFSRTPGTIRRPAPTLGEHNEAVLGGLLDLTAAELAELTDTQIIGTDAATLGKW